MTDHDHGYPPYQDEPLAFDARQSQGRRGFPTTLVVSLVILIGLGGAIFMFYRQGVRGAGEGPAQVGTPIGDIKAAPPPEQAQAQAPKDGTSGMQIYKSDGATPANASTQFGAGPEQPPPPPAPTAPVIAKPIIPAVPISPADAAAAVASGATTHAPPQAVAAAPAAKPTPPVKLADAKPVKPVHAKSQDDVDALLNPTPAAKAVAAAPEDGVLQPAVHGAAMAQIGAYSSSDLARKGLSDLGSAYGDDLAGKHWKVEPVAHEGKTLYRAAISGFATRDAAVAFCGKLKAAGKPCIVR
jgi:hypothetical protein